MKFVLIFNGFVDECGHILNVFLMKKPSSLFVCPSIFNDFTIHKNILVHAFTHISGTSLGIDLL